MKRKHKDVLDVICAAVIGPVTQAQPQAQAQAQATIAGLPVNGQLKIVGRSTVLSTKVGRELPRHLRPARPGHPWPEEISGG